jgi:plasmid maintenance system killer protein
VRFLFTKKKLQSLYESETGASKYPQSVVDAFFEVLAMIEAAENSQVFYQAKSLHFEKLKGQNEVPPMRSMRLNDQYRLELKLLKDQEGEYLEIHAISKHYE